MCALLIKPERRKVELETRYVGFEIPDRFAIGYGLDHGERYRNLPYVAALKRVTGLVRALASGLLPITARALAAYTGHPATGRNPSATLDHSYPRDKRSDPAGHRVNKQPPSMSRFFKSAAFPILIVVVLAFFAQKLIGGAEKSASYTTGSWSRRSKRRVQSLTLDQKDNSAAVVLKP